MSTSDINRKRQLHALFSYSAVTVFLYCFYKIYYHFSFGENSVYMKYAFLVTLLGGVLPSLVLVLTRKTNIVNRLMFNLYNSGLACVVAGFIINGIVTMSGRSTEVQLYFFIAGGIFAFASFYKS